MKQTTQPRFTPAERSAYNKLTATEQLRLSLIGEKGRTLPFSLAQLAERCGALGEGWVYKLASGGGSYGRFIRLLEETVPHAPEIWEEALARAGYVLVPGASPKSGVGTPEVALVEAAKGALQSTAVTEALALGAQDGELDEGEVHYALTLLAEQERSLGRLKEVLRSFLEGDYPQPAQEGALE